MGTLPGNSKWLMDFKILEPKGIMQVIVAVERLDRGAEISRGRVVAGVSFGFWAGLVSKSYEELWRQQLRGVFTDGSLRRRDLTSPMRQLQTFRNRLAHHDCLLAQPLEERYEQMIQIARWIDLDAATWISDQSTVPRLLRERPSAA